MSDFVVEKDQVVVSCDCGRIHTLKMDGEKPVMKTDDPPAPNPDDPEPEPVPRKGGDFLADLLNQ